MVERNSTSFFSLVFIFLAAISSIGLLLDRAASDLLIVSYFAAFFSYFWLVRFHSDQKLLYLGIAARLLLFIGLPTLSDDIYRFIWDGALILKGVDPYQHIPSDLLSAENASLFDKLNSQTYHSVYPPLNQLLFSGVVSLGGDNLLLTTNIIRLALLGAELGSYFILKYLLNDNGHLASWYFLNPLFILEVVGNCHFEGFVVLFMLTSISLIRKSKFLLSGGSLGLAIATKLLPMIFVPAFFFKTGWKKGIILGSVAMIAGLAPFLLFSSTSSLAGLRDSLSLYFQKFEFNASLYYLVRAYGYWQKGYNTIATAGPYLSLVSGILILALAYVGARRNWKLESVLLFALSTYLLFATTVHPWYILPLIPLGLLSGYWFPIVWSAFIFLTYVGYHTEIYHLPIWIVAVEYVVVFCVASYELYFHAKKR